MSRIATVYVSPQSSTNCLFRTEHTILIAKFQERQILKEELHSMAKRMAEEM